MSESFGPFDVRAGVLQRSPKLIDLLVRQRPGTTGLQLMLSDSLVDAYGTLYNSGLSGSGVSIASGGPIPVNTMYTSPSVVWKTEEYRRNQTSFVVNPEDFPNVIDDNYLYFRIQEQRAGGLLAVPGGATHNANYPIMGPTLIVPPPSFWGTSAGIMSVQSYAPVNTTCTGGSPPFFDPTVQIPLPMHFVLPRPAATATVTNLASVYLFPSLNITIAGSVSVGNTVTINGQVFTAGTTQTATTFFDTAQAGSAAAVATSLIAAIGLSTGTGVTAAAGSSAVAVLTGTTAGSNGQVSVTTNNSGSITIGTWSLPPNTSNNLLVCFGMGQTMQTVTPGTAITPTGGGVTLPGLREIIVAADVKATGIVPFSVEVTIGFERG